MPRVVLKISILYPPPHVPQHSACCLNHACFDDGNYSNFRIAFSVNAISHACMEIDFGVPTHMACRLRRMCNCEVQNMRYICDKYPFFSVTKQTIFFNQNKIIKS